MRHTTLALLVAFIAAPALAQNRPDPEPVKVPFTLLPSRHMLMDVKVNGKGPYKLIFDTGAPINLVSSKLGKETGLVKKGGGGLLGFGIFGGGLNQVEIKTLQLGEVIGEKLPAVVMDHPTVRAISDAFEDEYGTIHGIVGFPFFARFATTIDYQKKEMLLKPTDYVPGDYLQDLTNTLTKAAERKVEPKIVGSAGLWGLAVAKGDEDAAGVDVTKVYPGAPAAAGGLKVGDRVLTIDGRWTDTVADAYLAASLVKPGRTVDVVVKRDGRETTVTVTPAKGY